MNKILAALKILFKNPLYLLLALLLAALLFAVYFVVNDLSYYRTALGISSSLWFLWQVFAHHLWLVSQATSTANVAVVGLVAILGGINLSLTALRVVRTKVWVGRAGFPALAGILGGALGASCAACSTALISLLGVSGGLALLPFKGLEVSLVAAFLLLVSLYFLGQSLVEFGQMGEGVRKSDL
ncbi:MAG: hypothetical protein WEC39_02455 [Patescibacteria group bacterium]